MNPRESPTIVNPTESKSRCPINLSALAFNFCSDEHVKSYLDQKLQGIRDRDKWIEENKRYIEQDKAIILKAVGDGLIPDDQPETIWRFNFNKAAESTERVLQIKKELGGRVEEIKTIVAERLSGFLPDWILNKATVTFTMSDTADFCIDKDNITVDLGRLAQGKDFFGETIKGITHELFHVWMSEKSDWSDAEQASTSDKALRDRIIFETVDEGLAVLVSGQSLKAHHEKQGIKYDYFIRESFATFNNFISVNSREELEKIREKEFQNMGHFYVVGNEVAQAVLNSIGIVNFKELLPLLRKNPARIFELYRKACVKDTKLPVIQFVENS